MPIRILQTIATGWLGLDALQGGISAAALGFRIALWDPDRCFGALFDRDGANALDDWHIAYCLRYGVRRVMIYACMHLVVLPLSNAPHFKPNMLNTIC